VQIRKFGAVAEAAQTLGFKGVLRSGGSRRPGPRNPAKIARFRNISILAVQHGATSRKPRKIAGWRLSPAVLDKQLSRCS
jgi:hypothetical protein